jgi:MFS family permease
MDTAGAFIGVSVSLVLLMMLKATEPETSAFRMLYYISFFPSAIGVVLLATVREIRPPVAKQEQAEQPVHLDFNRDYYATLVLFAVMSLGLSSDAFLLLRAGDAGWPVEAVIVAYLIYNASYSLLSYPIGHVADRVRKETLLGIGMFVYSGVYVGFAAMPSRWIIWPLFAVYGLYAALTDGVGKALISGLVSSRKRATALGLFYMVSGVCVLIASLAAGWLWDTISPAAPFYLGAALAFISGMGFLVWKPTEKKSSQPLSV